MFWLRKVLVFWTWNYHVLSIYWLSTGGFVSSVIKDTLEAPGHLNELIFRDTWWKEHFPNSVLTKSIKTIQKMYQGGSSLAQSVS